MPPSCIIIYAKFRSCVELALARAVGQGPGAAREGRPNCELGVARASPRLGTDSSQRVCIEQSGCAGYIFSFSFAIVFLRFLSL
jgi:hypothetical protein